MDKQIFSASQPGYCYRHHSIVRRCILLHPRYRVRKPVFAGRYQRVRNVVSKALGEQSRPVEECKPFYRPSRGKAEPNQISSQVFGLLHSPASSTSFQSSATLLKNRFLSTCELVVVLDGCQSSLNWRQVTVSFGHTPGSCFCTGSSIAAAPGWDTRVRPSNFAARGPPRKALTGIVTDWPFPSFRLRSCRVEREPAPAMRRPAPASLPRSRTAPRKPTCGA